MRNSMKCTAAIMLLSCFLMAQAKKPVAKAPEAPAAAPAVDASLPSVEFMENYFKRMFGYDPNVQVRVASITPSAIPELAEAVVVFISPEGQQVNHWYISKDQKHVIAGDLLPFGADPFGPDRAELAKSAFGPTSGPADAKLVMVEFADLECPSCREAQPVMEKLRADFPDAKFIFQSFPLAQLHPWAVRASSYLDCIARSNNEQAFTFAQAVFTHQKDIETIVRRTDDSGKVVINPPDVTERMRHYAEMAGADPAKTQQCAESPATAERIARGQALGQKLGVTGTPTLFVNGRKVGNPGGVQYESLKGLIAFEAEQAAAGK